MGRRYIEQSYPVLVIMIVACTCGGRKAHRDAFCLECPSIPRGPRSRSLRACQSDSQHHSGAPIRNHRDAFGTAIPLACSTIFFMPRHVCKLLSIRVGTYLREAYALPFMLTIPLLATFCC